MNQPMQVSFLLKLHAALHLKPARVGGLFRAPSKQLMQRLQHAAVSISVRIRSGDIFVASKIERSHLFDGMMTTRSSVILS
jgi:hypothetical protein